MLAIVGGTGLYTLPGLNLAPAGDADTPFGRASSAVLRGVHKGRELLFLPAIRDAA